VRGLPRSKEQIKNGGWGAPDMDKFPKEHGGSVAVIVHCEGGHVLVPNYSSASAYDKDGMEVQKWSGAGDHFQNFIKAVHSRKYADLNADILEGHLSSALCHTGNISYRLGKLTSQEEIEASIKKSPALLEAFGRMVDHLKLHEVDLAATKVRLGVALTMDPKSERFIGNDKANTMLTREYRKPYVVPEKV
jgi:hypothetical protein